MKDSHCELKTLLVLVPVELATARLPRFQGLHSSLVASHVLWSSAHQLLRLLLPLVFCNWCARASRR